MYRVNFLGLLVFLLFIMGFESCKKDCYDPFNPDCVDYDPCIGEVKADAEFGFYNRKVSGDTVFWIPVVDTFYNWCGGGGRSLFFRAKNSNMDSYEWTVGSDPRAFSDSVFLLNFDCISGPINTTLIVNKESLEECFSEEMKIDTISKVIDMKIISSFEEFPIYGMFKGYNEDDPSTEFTMGLEPLNGGYLKNFPNNCDDNTRFFLTGRSFMINSEPPYPYQCNRPEGFGTLQDDNNTLIINYSILEEIEGKEVRVSKRFIGTRVN